VVGWAWWCVFWVKILSTVGVHTLWMRSELMTPLQCRAVGQTPIYDQLRAERINANMSLGDVDSSCLVFAGRHCVDVDAPCAAAIWGHPQGRDLPHERSPSVGCGPCGDWGDRRRAGVRGKRLVLRRLGGTQHPTMAALGATTASSCCTRLDDLFQGVSQWS
jgi:hypothetical protein